VAREPAAWDLRHPFGTRTLVLVVAALLVLAVSGRRVEIDRLMLLTREEAGGALGGVARALFPPRIAERTDVARIEGFDPARLPWLAWVERETAREVVVDRRTLEPVTVFVARDVLVQPVGYLVRVLGKMVETLEIALWATLLAVALSAPLALGGARNATPHAAVYVTARATVSLLRAVPEMVSALFLVLAVGFGALAGILALGLHSAGFLGKFYAEDIENADRGPQEALEAIGAHRLAVLAYAVVPQVFPQYVAYTLYVLDRNVRMAIVVGIVGAGGIGQEMKGRFDMFDYAHVTTILLVLFATVFLLDRCSARLRARLM
jgi:phosphonate transport system permease protein